MCGACQTVVAANGTRAEWENLAIDFGPLHPVDAGRLIGDGPNPQVALPVDRLRGRWVRFSGIVDRSSTRIGMRINASSAIERTGSVPVACDGRATMSRCTTSFWVPPDIEQMNAVIWADGEVGQIFEARVEVATLSGTGSTIGHRVDPLVARVREAYYRTDDVDWPVIQRTIAAIPAPPDDLDPAPAIAQFLKSHLPGNKHVVVWPRSLTIAPASTSAMPGCDATVGDIGIVTLPGLTQIFGDAPSTYAKALHDCLMHDDRRAWIVDLRKNSGGNMYPMIGGLAPLLPVARLYAFVDGHRGMTAEIGIDGSGVTVNRQLAFDARDAGQRTTAPVIVVYGKSCGSSCEQTANALAARPRTLFVGEPSAGYLTANVPLPINDDYVLLLTTGYTTDRCDRVIEDNLVPDVTVDGIADMSIGDVLAVPSVRGWLADQLHDRSSPVVPLGACVQSQ